MASFLANLTWRRAVKRFGSTGPVPDIKPVLDAIYAAPTAFGMQPFTVHVVTDAGVKARLREVSYNQPQLTESTHVLVFSARTDMHVRAEEYIKATGTPSPAADNIRASYSVARFGDPAASLAYSSKNAGIALGFGLAAATERKIFSCPMNGFDPVKYAEILSLPKNATPIAVLALGREAEEGQVATPWPRFNFPREEVFKTV